MSQSKHLFFVIAVVFFAATIAEADIISVNFHVEDDGDAQAAHEFDGTETAGVGSFNTSFWNNVGIGAGGGNCLLYTSPSPRDQRGSRMPSSA